MAISTYNELQSGIGNWLERDDLTARIPEFIALAEARHKREVRIREMLTRADLSISDGDRYVDLPADFLDHKYLRIRVPNNMAVRGSRRYFPDLLELNVHEMTQQSTNDERRPCNYVIHEQIEFDSEADQDYDGELFYYVELDALSDTNATNALLTRAPDVYLYAALSESAPFLMHDERIQVWEAKYAAARDTLNRSQSESRRGGPLVSRVSGRTP